ncbi:ATP-binding protein [Caloramator sp. mosi_1]|uniref:ATP-binding protein n=1 Tax=Caloramator sp. mosi_1 TaxID=3023090 RepID=UPI003081D5B7
MDHEATTSIGGGSSPNAIRHSTGKVEINLYKEDDRVKFEVINSGSNIPQDEIEYIWNKFYKIDKSGNKRYGGTGLGLSIVKILLNFTGRGWSYKY